MHLQVFKLSNKIGALPGDSDEKAKSTKIPKGPSGKGGRQGSMKVPPLEAKDAGAAAEAASISPAIADTTDAA